MAKLLPALLLGAALVAAPASAAPQRKAEARQRADAQLDKLLHGRVAGTPTDCISLSSARSSEIIEGRAIVYRVGGRLYVNEPQSGADSLDDDDILVTKTIGSQLCRLDSINLVDRSSRFPHGFVILGKFVPWSKPKAAR